MISTLAVAGYRSLRDVRLHLGGLTVVTGANGSGKSNLYRALRLLADCARGEVVGSLAREGVCLRFSGPVRSRLERASDPEIIRHRERAVGNR